MTGGRSLRRLVGTAAALAVAAGVAVSVDGGPVAPDRAQAASCITRLPVTYQFPSKYGAAYKGTVPVRVTTRGPRVKYLRAQLYTFSGRLLAQGKARGSLTSSKTVRMKLNRRLGRTFQAGKYTLVLTGEPNASRSCGPKQRIKVVRFSDCTTKLPVTFPGLPKGLASDYGDQLTVRVSTTGQVLKGVAASLSTFDGRQLDTAKIGTLFGEKSVTFTVPGGVQPGGYTVSVSGVISEQPSSCGPKSGSTTLEFN